MTNTEERPEWFDQSYVPRDRVPHLSALRQRPEKGEEDRGRMARIRETNEAWDRNPPPGHGRSGPFRRLDPSIDRDAAE